MLKLGATPVTLTSTFCLGKYLVGIIAGMSIGDCARRDRAKQGDLSVGQIAKRRINFKIGGDCDVAHDTCISAWVIRAAVRPVYEMVA